MRHKRHARHHKTEGPEEEGNGGAVATLERPQPLDFTERRRLPQDIPVQDKVQGFDPIKGWDLTKYDLRKGEIGNPAVPNPHAPKVAPVMANQSTGLCVECGKPVAPAQNYVCRSHVRSN